MSLDSIIISILSTIVTIINSYAIIKYSHYYTLKKKRDEIVKVLFAYKPKELGKNLKSIREDATLLKFYIYIFISLIFLLIVYLMKIDNTFTAYNTYEVISTFLLDYGIATFILFVILFVVGNVLKNTNFDARMQSHWLYVFIKSLYPTTSDWLFMFISYLLFGLLIYTISPKLNAYCAHYLLVQTLEQIVFYSGILFLVEILIFIVLRTVTEDIRLFEDLDSLVFKDVRESIKIRVWTKDSVYEGEIGEIGDDLVISSAGHTIRIPWDSIQTFEVIMPKQSSIDKLYFI